MLCFSYSRASVSFSLFALIDYATNKTSSFDGKVLEPIPTCLGMTDVKPPEPGEVGRC